MENLSQLEEQLMLYIWQFGKGFVKNYREMYPLPKLPYTTLATIIKRLETKGYVISKLQGNIYEYHINIKFIDYLNQQISSMVNKYFQNSIKEMICFLIKERKLSIKDLIEIIETNTYS